LFGTALGELTGAEVSRREAPHRPAWRSGRVSEPPSAPAPSAGGAGASRRIPRREAPRESAPPRALPIEAPGADIARWAGEREPPATSGPARKRKRDAFAGEARPEAPDLEAVALHRREMAARSRRPLSVAGTPGGSREESAAARERPAGPAAPEASGHRGRTAAPGPDVSSDQPLPAAPEAASGEAAARPPLVPLPAPEGRGNGPWGTPVSGAQAPRSLLAGAARENPPHASRRKDAAPGRPDAGRPDAGRPAPPLVPGGDTSPAGPAAPDLPRSSRDRSDAPELDAREGHPPPFAPIAGDPRAPHPAASPLGPFPGAPASSRALHEPAQAVAASPPEAFSAFFSPPPGSADELSELAAKIERILADEAR